MKCPRCKYISFDYNERCPKCSKDLAVEKAKLQLVAFKHNPPFFLGALTHDTGDFEDDLYANTSIDAAVSEEEDLEMRLETELLSEPVAEEELSLDVESLEGRIRGSDEDALEFAELQDISLDETLAAAHPPLKGAPGDSGEMVTAQIRNRKPPLSRDDEEIELDHDQEKPESES